MKKIVINDKIRIECPTVHQLFRNYKVFTSPDFQRIVDMDNVNRIKESYLKNPNCILDSEILIGYDNVLDRNYIIDGQHRITALSDIIDLIPDALVNIKIKTCKDMDELFETYKNRNSNSPLEDFQKVLLEENVGRGEVEVWLAVERYIKTNYKAYLKKDMNCKKPNVSLDYVMNKLKSSHILSVYRSGKEVIDRLNVVNQRIYNAYIEKCKSGDDKTKEGKKAIDTMANTITKINEHTQQGQVPFCFGLDIDWSVLLTDDTHPILFAEYEDTKISPKDRNQMKHLVWETYAPQDTVTGKPAKHMCCFSCKSVQIVRDTTNWHLGHVNAKRYGGNYNAENLRPVCTDCNSKMKTRNMYEFMESMGYD
jgi:hypothetical protein